MKLKKALKIIKSYCMKSEHCGDCPFDRADGCYWTSGYAPEDWPVKGIINRAKWLRDVGLCERKTKCKK